MAADLVIGFYGFGGGAGGIGGGGGAIASQKSGKWMTKLKEGGT